MTYSWQNEDGEPIMSGEAWRFEQQLDMDSQADYYEDHFYDFDPEPDECVPGHPCEDCYRTTTGDWFCEYCDQPCVDHDDDGAPEHQWQVTTPPEVYWNGE